MAVVPGGWSVSCEAAFYVALPGILWAIRGRIWRVALLALLAIVAVQLYARHQMATGPWSYVPDYIHPLVQAPVFLVGILAAMIATRFRLPRVPGLVYLLLSAGIVMLPLAPSAPWRVLPHLVFAGIAAAAVALAAQQRPWLLSNSVMRRIGEVSFSIYLWHFALLAPSLWLTELVCYLPTGSARSPYISG